MTHRNGASQPPACSLPRGPPTAAPVPPSHALQLISLLHRRKRLRLCLGGTGGSRRQSGGCGDGKPPRHAGHSRSCRRPQLPAWGRREGDGGCRWDAFLGPGSKQMTNPAILMSCPHVPTTVAGAVGRASDKQLQVFVYFIFFSFFFLGWGWG